MYVNSDSSDWLNQSVSSSASWYDDLEGETTTKLADQLEHLDHILYGEAGDKHFPHGGSIVNECHQWKLQFPHLRVNGSSIKVPASCQTESNREQIEEIIEDIFAAHGEYSEEDKNSEEINVTEPDLSSSDDKIVVSDNIDNQEVFKEKIKSAVLEQIFIRIWPSVLKQVEPFLNSIKNDRKFSYSDSQSSRTCKTEISTDDDNCEVISSSLNRLTLTPIVNSSVSLPGRLKSVRNCSSNMNRNHTAVFSIKSVVIEPPASLLSLPARNTTALKSPVKLLQTVIKFPSPERLLSPIPAGEIKSTGTCKKKQSAKTAVERKCIGQSCKSQVHNDSRCGGRRILKTSPPSNMSRHITLPPIETNVQFSAGKVRSMTGKRCVSALWKVEPELRPSTSHGNKSYLSPLDINFSTNTSRPEVDSHWLDEQQEYTCSGKSKIGLPKQQDQKVKWKSRSTVRK